MQFYSTVNPWLSYIHVEVCKAIVVWNTTIIYLFCDEEAYWLSDPTVGNKMGSSSVCIFTYPISY